MLRDSKHAGSSLAHSPDVRNGQQIRSTLQYKQLDAAVQALQPALLTKSAILTRVARPLQDDDEECTGGAPGEAAMESQGARVRRSLVVLDVSLPSIALPDGVHSRAFTGAGLPASPCDWPWRCTDADIFISIVFNANQELQSCRAACAGNGVVVHQDDTLGLVVTDRNTVPVSVGDVVLSFGAHPAEVDASVRFLHPLHNFAILSYNPADLPQEVSRQLSGWAHALQQICADGLQKLD